LLISVAEVGMTRVFFVLALTLWALPWQTAPTTSVRTWLGHEPQIEAHLKTAEVISLEDIGTGVTRPRRAHLMPSTPVESLVWKVLPPGRRGGFWESYKSEIAAYELDKLLQMDMVPPAVERHVRGDVGAAVMWLEGIRSVKELGGTVPTGVAWGRPIRKMRLFDNLIGNPDRNAGNILIGPPGEMILIDHSRAFTGDKKLPNPVERVDAVLWEQVRTASREDLTRTLSPWMDEDAIDALIARRDRIIETVDRLVKEKGRALVIIP
jgi:hypothetical protein